METFQIAFENTGDTISFNAVDSMHYEILCFYVDNLYKNNSFSFNNKKLHKHLVGLKQAISNVNTFITFFKDSKYIEGDTDIYLNPDITNKIHADFVNDKLISVDVAQLLRKHANTNFNELSILLRKKFSNDCVNIDMQTALHSLDLTLQYSEINISIHRIERYFKKIVAQTNEWVNIENPFNKSLATMNICHFNIDFFHSGRTLYNKFTTGDMNLEYKDENTFNELVGCVSLKLVPEETIQYSKEYISWCASHDIDPIGNRIGIGIIPDLMKNLTKYRKIIHRNQNNYFSIIL